MRKFFTLIICITLLGSFLLLFYFRYNATTVVYHLSVVLLGQLIVTLIATGMFLLVRNKKLYTTFLNIILFLNLFTLVSLYLLILSSNYFWKKTITYPVIKNYFLKVDDFITALPIESWIFYTGITFIFLFICLLFYLCRPRTQKLYNTYGQLRNRRLTSRFFIALGACFFILFFFRGDILRLKRIMLFSEEPFLQFALGNLWGQGNEMAFEKERFLLGERDKACLDSIEIKPNNDNHPIVIILLDALRSDHLSFYGYNRITTPFLDSLHQAGKIVAVKNAFSPSTNTVGGVAGLFFSRDWENFGYTGLNLMKYLKRAGYTTYSFLTGYHRDWFGLSALYRGSCDYYYESPKDPEIPPDDDLITLEKFAATKLKKQSFIYIHLLSTHTIGEKSTIFKRYFPDKIGLTGDKKTALINNYDNGILQADFVIRNIFNKLESEQLLKESTIFILSDHGELFGEGGQWSHGGNVQHKLINIPLLIYDPNLNWYKNTEAATLKDIAPTIIERLGYPVPQCWEGTSLHSPPHNFSLKINSITECDYPYGLLTKIDSSYSLTIMNKEKKIIRTVTKLRAD